MGAKGSELACLARHQSHLNTKEDRHFMFSPAKPVQYQGKIGQEHIWFNGEQQESSSCCFAGTLLGSEIVRIRFLHTTYPEGLAFQLVDEKEGTLPYHSWIVSTGDETWNTSTSDTEALTALEPYLQGFAFSEELLEQGFHIVPVINPGIKIDQNYFVYQQGLKRGYLCRKEGG